jgi:hypothetical protein
MMRRMACAGGNENSESESALQLSFVSSLDGGIGMIDVRTVTDCFMNGVDGDEEHGD